MVEATTPVLARMMAEGRYHAWVLTPEGRPDDVVAGAGVQEQGLVLNVYTEPAWRRQGAGERLMRAVLEWSAARGLASLILHASDEGRPLYERLGFVGTNEMRWSGMPVR